MRTLSDADTFSHAREITLGLPLLRHIQVLEHDAPEVFLVSLVLDFGRYVHRSSGRSLQSQADVASRGGHFGAELPQ
jgi:hypothetical protein